MKRRKLPEDRDQLMISYIQILNHYTITSILTHYGQNFDGDQEEFGDGDLFHFGTAYASWFSCIQSLLQIVFLTLIYHM